MSNIVTVHPDELHQLIQTKLEKAGLLTEQADEVARHLVYADRHGVHSHGAVRVDYYAERIANGGVTKEPNVRFEQTGPSTGIFHGDNGVGQYVGNLALEPTIKMAKESGVAVVGISKMSHSGMLAYYVQKAAEHDLIAIAMCQSDPMVVPYGGVKPFYGTNPIAFAAPSQTGKPIVFDMATSVQAWGKILDARSKNKAIPDTWAVNKKGLPTTDPFDIGGLLPIAGPKGYGLMMMVDILAGTLLGLPFGDEVSSMYTDLTKGRDLGQMFIFIDPSRFIDLNVFKASVSTLKHKLSTAQPAEGVERVYYPGEISQINNEKYAQGVPVEENIYNYLISDQVHLSKYSGKTAFV